MLRMRLSGYFNRTSKLFDDFGMQDVSGMKGDDHTDIVLEIYPMAAFAAEESETRFQE